MKYLLIIFLLFTAFGYSQSVETTNTPEMPELKLKAQTGFSIANNVGVFTSVDYFFKPKTFFGIEIHTSALESKKPAPGMDLGFLSLDDQYTSYMFTWGKLSTNPNNNKHHVNLKVGLGLVYYDKVIDYKSTGGFLSFSYDEIRENGMTPGMTIDLSFQKIGKHLGFMIGPFLNMNLERPYASFKIGLVVPMRN